MKTINIPLSDQVTSIEVSRELTEKLKGVGIVVESFRYWGNFRHKHYVTKEWLVPESWSGWQLGESKFAWGNGKGGCEVFPAYTLPELLAVLPNEVIRDNHNGVWKYVSISRFYLKLEKFSSDYRIGYLTCDNEEILQPKDENDIKVRDAQVNNTNPTTAAAKLLIWCIDNGYIGEEI